MSVELSSPVQQRSFAARLKRGVADSYLLSKRPFGYSSKKPVAGEVWTWSDGSIRFSIFRRRALLDAFSPRLAGKILSAGSGSKIIAAVDRQHFVFSIVFLPILTVALIVIFHPSPGAAWEVLREFAGQLALVFSVVATVTILLGRRSQSYP